MKKLVVFLLLATAIGGAYYNAVGNGFVFDDYLLVVHRPVIPLVASNPMLALSPSVVGYRPLRTASYGLDYRVGGMSPWVFHLNNIIYHWIAACLVFLVTLQLVARREGTAGSATVADSSGSGFPTRNFELLIALLVALLWALHPIQTDAVTYISGRRDILTGLFFFLGLYAFLNFRRQVSRGKQAWWLILALLSYACALLSKEMAVTLPLVMLLYDAVYTMRRTEVRFGWRSLREFAEGVWKAVWEYKYLYVPLLLAGAGFSLYATFIMLPAWRVPWHGGSSGTNFLTTARIWVYYCYLLIWPWRLLADYSGAFRASSSLVDPWAGLAVAFLLVLFLVILFALRYSRLAVFAGLWIPITLLPVSHIVPYPEMLAEHYLYIPSFGFCLLVALGLMRLAESCNFRVSSSEVEKDKQVLSLKPRISSLWRPVLGYGLLLSLLFFYAGRTLVRNRDWRDEFTFYSRLVEDNPSSARARLGLGYAYDRGGMPRIAITQYTIALKLSPQDPRLLTNRGAAHQKLGELKEAEKDYLAVLKMRPQDHQTMNNLGFLYTEQREFDKARSFLEEADRLSKGRDPAVVANFALLEELQGKLPEALDTYEKAKVLNPDSEFLSQKIEELKKKIVQPNHDAAVGSEHNQLATPE